MHLALRALRAPAAFDGSDFLPGGATVLVDGDLRTDHRALRRPVAVLVRGVDAIA